MDDEVIRYERDGRTAVITLNRPGKLNALDDDAVAALRAALIRLDEDEDAHIGIIHGEGRAFCSGADVQQRHLRPDDELRRFGGPQARGTRVGDLLFDLGQWKPVITAVHGYVLGAGLHIALLADAIVAAPGTKFQITEIPRGLDGGVFWSLMRDAGAGAFADDAALTGRMWTAEEGVAANVVTRLSEPGAHLEAAHALAGEILANPPLAVRELVRIRRHRMRTIEIEHDATGSRHLHLTEDFKESALAFAQKRQPGPFHAR